MAAAHLRPIDSMFLTHGQSQSFFTRLRARKSSASQSTITPAEAVWFLSLPDKVRRQHFTKEEQILIRAKSELVLLDAAPHVLSHVEDTNPRSRSLRHDSTVHHDLPSMPTTSFLSTTDDIDSFPGSPVSSFATCGDTPRIEMPESFNENPFTAPSSFFRSPSIRHSTWSRSTTSTQSSPNLDTRSDFETPIPTRTARAALPPSLPLNKPLYLKDPNAKEFLRDCFDKSKFEECLNFGFPSNLGSRSMDYDMISPGTKVRANWLDLPLDGDDEEDDVDADDCPDSSSVDERDLCTPTSIAHPPQYPRHHSVANSDTSDKKAAASPVVPRNASNSSYFEELMNRDMTLRMTLTKPELRATDEELYGWQASYEEVPPEGLVVEKDPLALEDLSFSDDVTGLQGAFARDQARKKGIKGLWSRK